MIDSDPFLRQMCALWSLAMLLQASHRNAIRCAGSIQEDIAKRAVERYLEVV